MLANHIIKRRDGYRDKRDIKTMKLHFRECKLSIEGCAERGSAISVSVSHLKYPEVVQALRLIGFTLGRTFEDHNPSAIGYIRRHLQYLIPT
jgi:hypothetical protein